MPPKPVQHSRPTWNRGEVAGVHGGHSRSEIAKRNQSNSPRKTVTSNAGGVVGEGLFQPPPPVPPSHYKRNHLHYPSARNGKQQNNNHNKNEGDCDPAAISLADLSPPPTQNNNINNNTKTSASSPTTEKRGKVASPSAYHLNLGKTETVATTAKGNVVSYFHSQSPRTKQNKNIKVSPSKSSFNDNRKSGPTKKQHTRNVSQDAIKRNAAAASDNQSQNNEILLAKQTKISARKRLAPLRLSELQMFMAKTTRQLIFDFWMNAFVRTVMYEKFKSILPNPNHVPNDEQIQRHGIEEEAEFFSNEILRKFEDVFARESLFIKWSRVARQIMEQELNSFVEIVVLEETERELLLKQKARF
jgi:hypothetical protein